MHHRNQITIQITVRAICHPRVCHQTEETNQLAMNLKQSEAQSARASSNVPLVEFMYLVFTRIPGESYRSRLRPLLL